MKKLLAMFLLCAMLFALCGCGEEEVKEFDLCGTWKVAFVEYEGSSFTVEEWLNMEDDDLSDFFIIFKEGGQAYVFDDDYGNLENWLQSEDKVMIGDEKCSLIDQKIRYDYYDDIIYLEKVSDSQEIPNTSGNKDNDDGADDDEEEIDDTDTDVTNADTPSTNNSEWREFLIEYEEWVDAYIDTYQKVLDNPLDTSLYAEYLELLDEATDWTERATAIEEEIDDYDELVEFSDELLRIAEKISESIS